MLPLSGMARPLAPQPSAMQPVTSHMQPTQNTYSLTSTRSRRGTVIAACHECRTKKLKCDGGRPRCQRCFDKGIETCQYTVNPGETRFTALKRKNAALSTDSDRMRNLIETLRSASPSEAQHLLQNLRASENASDFLESMYQSQRRPSLHQSSSSPSSSLPPLSGLDGTNATRHSSGSLSSSPDAVDPAYQQPFNSIKGPSRSTGSSAGQSSTNFETQMPSERVLRECISAFYSESGRLFHVFSWDYVERQLSVLSERRDEQSWRLAACELCGIGAIGAQYVKDNLHATAYQQMYGITKRLFEDVINVDALRAAKLTVLLAMFNIMNKEKVAMAFVEMGLNLLQRLRGHTRVCPVNMDRRRWIEVRKTWRVLIFLESWISSTLGYISGVQWLPGSMHTSNFEIEGETELEDLVETEMVKIAVIKFDLLRLSLSFKDLSALTVETITRDLQQWHQNIPKEMRLTDLTNNPKVSFELRRTIYYVNFLYFGAQIMLLRRVLQTLNEDSNSMCGAESAINNLIFQANAAARESAILFHRLREEGGIVRRCWICIFQAYSSCVLILHDTAQTLLHTTTVGRADEDLKLAAACMDFLEYCSSTDVAAERFFRTLTSFHNTLKEAASNSRTGSPTRTPGLETTLSELRDLVCMPFKTRGRQAPDTLYLWKQQRGQQDTDEPNIRDMCDSFGQQRLGSPSPPSSDDWQGIDGIKNDGMINDLLSAMRPGRFLPGFESYAWSGGEWAV